MKTRVLTIFGIFIFSAVIGSAFAIHDPDQPHNHSIILPPNVKEMTSDRFMEWCKPHYGEKKCTELYIENRTTGLLPPLKQMQSGTEFHNVQCREGLQLVYKRAGDSSACVTRFTWIELVVRGWATDSRIMLGCTGDRVHTCYPDDPVQYRDDLYEYYFGDEKDLPSSDTFDFDSLHTKNACTNKPWICYGKFENGTQMRIACDYPLHGCGVKLFEGYKVSNDETITMP